MQVLRQQKVFSNKIREIIRNKLFDSSSIESEVQSNIFYSVRHITDFRYVILENPVFNLVD